MVAISFNGRFGFTRGAAGAPSVASATSASSSGSFPPAAFAFAAISNPKSHSRRGRREAAGPGKIRGRDDAPCYREASVGMVNGTFPYRQPPGKYCRVGRQGWRFLPRAGRRFFVNLLSALGFLLWHAPCFVVRARP